MKSLSNPPFAESRLLIDGVLVRSSSGATFENVGPATGQVIGYTADATAQDFERAIASSRRAFDTTDWSTNPALRAHCLRQLSQALEAHKEQIRSLIVTEIGTAVWLTRDTLLEVPIKRIAEWAELAEQYSYVTELPDLDFRGVASRRLQRREPIGVVAGIVPWNGPWGTILTTLGPALAAGNTIIIKPSPDAPWAGTVVGRIIAEQTDIPPGVVNVVAASDHQLSELLTNDPRVDMIAFTGSVPNGRRVAEVGARTIKRLLLELGGKSPYVVLDSADVAKEATLAARLICGNAGQGCVARTRLLLPRSRYEEGISAARESMAKITVGDPRDPNNFMGPLISAQHRQRVLGYIERAKADGNRLVYGGRIPPDLPNGFFIEPTLFADVKPKDTIAQEEIFGPVLAVIAYDTREEALDIANDSIFGLSATVAAGTDDEALEFAARLRTGTVSVNGGVWMGMDVPFGGYKQSGLGRQFGVPGFEAYLETKVIGLPSGKPSASLAWGEIE